MNEKNYSICLKSKNYVSIFVKIFMKFRKDLNRLENLAIYIYIYIKRKKGKRKYYVKYRFKIETNAIAM
jgi:hypothetical protein